MEKKRNKLFLFLSFASMASIIIMLTLSLKVAYAAPAKELVIGAAYGMTGPWISYTIPFGKVWKIHAKRINNQGGITVGGEKYQLKLVEIDTKCTPEGGRSGAERLISLHGAKFILGPGLSSASLAALPLMMENKVINITPVTTQKVLTSNSKYYFKAHFPGALVSRVYPEFLADRLPKVRRMALVMPDDDAGRSESEETKTGVAKVVKKEPGRMEIVFEGYYPKGSTDHTPLLTAALAKKPDIIHLDAGAPDEMAVIVKEARDLGYKGWFISGGGFTLSRLNEIAGKDYAYNILHQAFDIERPTPVKISPEHEAKWKWFVDMFGEWVWLGKAWKVEYGEDMPEAVVYAVDGLPTMVQGILAANSLDTDKVVEALEGMKYLPTYFGMGTWMGKETWGINHQIRRPIPLYEIKYGKQFPVEPAVMPAVYP
jgi:branched-chain amino acid transport system substrate-binding protein